MSSTPSILNECQTCGTYFLMKLLNTQWGAISCFPFLLWQSSTLPEPGTRAQTAANNPHSSIQVSLRGDHASYVACFISKYHALLDYNSYNSQHHLIDDDNTHRVAASNLFTAHTSHKQTQDCHHHHCQSLLHSTITINRIGSYSPATS